MKTTFIGVVVAMVTQPFLRMALFASVSASIAGGVVGSYVVVKRIVFISGSIAHSVLGGLGAALYIKRVYHVEWLQPIHGALVAAILCSLAHRDYPSLLQAAGRHGDCRLVGVWHGPRCHPNFTNSLATMWR